MDYRDRYREFQRLPFSDVYLKFARDPMKYPEVGHWLLDTLVVSEVQDIPDKVLEFLHDLQDDQVGKTNPLVLPKRVLDKQGQSAQGIRAHVLKQVRDFLEDFLRTQSFPWMAELDGYRQELKTYKKRKSRADRGEVDRVQLQKILRKIVDYGVDATTVARTAHLVQAMSREALSVIAFKLDNPFMPDAEVAQRVRRDPKWIVRDE